MLVLKRKNGQWVEIRHRSGDLIRVRVYGISPDLPTATNLAFDDPARNFDIQRPERVLKGPHTPIAPAPSDDASA